MPQKALADVQKLEWVGTILLAGLQVVLLPKAVCLVCQLHHP